LIVNTSGSYNTGIGRDALQANTTANYNTALGYLAGYANTTGEENLFLGLGAGYNSTTGSYNTYVGRGLSKAAGSEMTTGSKNTILGAYTGNQNGLDIRTSSNNIVLSDGDGNPAFHINSNGDINAERFSSLNTPYTGDLNNLDKSGFYRSENSNSNNPTYAYYAVVVFGNCSNVVTQIATVLQGTTTYVRSFNTAWSAWQRLDT